MIQNLAIKREGIDFGFDSIVVKKFVNGILGGVMLDVTGYTENVVLAGQCVVTDGDGVYRPMPVNGDIYGQMPEGFRYAGVVYRSAKATEPVSIMLRGVVNKYKAPYPFKADFDVRGIILASDTDEADPFAGYDVISDITELPSEDTKEKSILLGSAVNGYTSSKYFKNIAVQDAEVDSTITLKATDKITLDGVTLAGGRDGVNGKITYAAQELELRNITAMENSTLYNAFEGYQKTNDPDYNGIKRLLAENINIDCPNITHNIINVYTPADGAEIIVRNSKFNITVDNTNPLRLANYLNAENVHVTFENVDWTYENGLTMNDWGWAGLVIYQPATSDVALHGDLSKISTWKFTFKNCRYNGVKVTSDNFGEHNQVIYFYNIGNDGKVAAADGVEIEFE